MPLDAAAALDGPVNAPGVQAAAQNLAQRTCPSSAPASADEGSVADADAGAGRGGPRRGPPARGRLHDDAVRRMGGPDLVLAKAREPRRRQPLGLRSPGQPLESR